MNTQWLYDLVLAGQPFIQQVQTGRSSFLDLLFQIVTFTGDLEFYLLVLPAVFWVFDKKLARHLVLILVLTFFINGIVKNGFQIPRPPQSLWLIEESGYGFISGHTQGAMTLWGFVAWYYRRHRWVLGAAALMIVAVGFSRLYLGVHYPMDVAGGLLMGALVLSTYVRFVPILERWTNNVSLSGAVSSLFLGSMIVLWLQPGDAVQYPFELAITLGGFVMGAGIGLWLEHRQVDFAQPGTVVQKIARYLLGLVLVFVAWEGTSMLADLLTVPFAVDVLIRYVRYLFVGLLMMYLVPMLFIRLGLATSQVEAATAG